MFQQDPIQQNHLLLICSYLHPEKYIKTLLLESVGNKPLSHTPTLASLSNPTIDQFSCVKVTPGLAIKLGIEA